MNHPGGMPLAGAVADDAKLEEIAPTPELKRPISKLVSQRLDGRNLSFKAWFGLSAVLVIGVGAICVVLWGSGMDFPASWGPSIGARVDSWVDWLKVNEATAWVLNQIKELLLRVMVNLEDALLWIPWPAAILAVALVAWRVSGPVLAATSGLALVAIGVMGRLPRKPGFYVGNSYGNRSVDHRVGFRLPAHGDSTWRTGCKEPVCG